MSRRDLYLSFRYAFRSPYRRSPVGGEPFLRRAVHTLESIPKRLGNSSWGCSRYDCSYSSSPNRRRVFLLPRNLARRLSSRVRPPIRTKDHIPLPEAKNSILLSLLVDFIECLICFKNSYLMWNIFILTNANYRELSRIIIKGLTLGTFESFMSHSWWGCCCCWLPATVADIVGDPTRLLWK